MCGLFVGTVETGISAALMEATALPDQDQNSSLQLYLRLAHERKTMPQALQQLVTHAALSDSMFGFLGSKG